MIELLKRSNLFDSNKYCCPNLIIGGGNGGTIEAHLRYRNLSYKRSVRLNVLGVEKCMFLNL